MACTAVQWWRTTVIAGVTRGGVPMTEGRWPELDSWTGRQLHQRRDRVACRSVTACRQMVSQEVYSSYMYTARTCTQPRQVTVATRRHHAISYAVVPARRCANLTRAATCRLPTTCPASFVTCCRRDVLAPLTC